MNMFANNIKQMQFNYQQQINNLLIKRFISLNVINICNFDIKFSQPIIKRLNYHIIYFNTFDIDMLRKNIRMRRQFIYTLQKQQQDKQTMAKKMKIQQADQSNQKIPTQLYKQSEKLRQQLQAHDSNNIIPRTHIDDQYADNLYLDPTILLTTSRDPSSRLNQFQKELSLIFPGAKRINRGAYTLDNLVELCQTKNVTDMLIVHEHRGIPDGLIITHFPLGPTVYFGLQNVVLRHDVHQQVNTVSEANPHLIFNNFTSQLGERVINIIKHLFPVPKVDSKRVMTFSNKDDLITFRHHTFQKINNKQVELDEIGPRFELKLYQIVLGLINQKQATKQWVLRPYMRTATKRKAL